MRANQESDGWQARKSAATRNLILDAAINCFIEIGYANTTTSKISQRAGLSRGAMLHHFPTKNCLVKAGIEYLHHRRIEAFRIGISQIPEDSDNQIREGLEVYWQHLTSPLFIAFHELTIASRTDPELSSILLPAIKAFDDEWFNTAENLFPEWQSKPKTVFQLVMDITQNLMEGMAINQFTSPNEQRTSRLLDWLEAELQNILTDEDTKP